MSRPRRQNLPAWLAVAALLPPLAAGAAGQPASSAARPAPSRASGDVEYFESRVRPLLLARCGSCHSAKVSQGGLRLDDPAAILRGGAGGRVVAPGKPEESRLVRAVGYTDTHLQMPPAGKLPEAEVAVLTEWVKRGAPVPAASTGPSGKRPPMSIEEGRRFWSIRPFRPTPPPRVKDERWIAKPIDRFILAKLESAGIQPSPPADPRTLIRRATFDLTGLPPTPDEVQQFVEECAQDKLQSPRSKVQSPNTEHRTPNTDTPTPNAQRPTPNAYTRLITRLLASPHYGERWGRHWLDLVRYCDIPESWAVTEAQPWRYRDWVVKAFNDDLPYDRFVMEQLAADELPGTPPEALAALGFLGLSPSYWKELKLAPDVIKTVVAEEWEERITAVSGTLLGLTAGCARCHDHKFDPITQKDYYALAGIFASTRLTPRAVVSPAEEASVLEARKKVAELEAQATLLKAAVDSASLSPEKQRQVDAALAKAKEIRQSTPHFDAPLIYGVETASLAVLADGPDHTKLDYRMGSGIDVPLQLRGSVSREADAVPRRFLTVLSTGEPARFTHGSGRRELGEAIFRDAAPLAARVIVNRVWKHHFGRGLVETPSNFGTQGDRPSHPELLDDLAARFIRSGWSLKWLHREIMLSAVYRQASVQSPKSKVQGLASSGRLVSGGLVPTPSAQRPTPERPNARTPERLNAQRPTPNAQHPTPNAIDPDNRLLWRMNRRRLEVEAWRDGILAASGQLDLQVGGAAQELGAPENRRRTLYGVVKRRELDDLLRLYDFPDPTAHSPARFNTITPLQQLYVLNSPFIARQAAALAARVRAEAPEGIEAQVRRAYLLLYGRTPESSELRAAGDFLSGPQHRAPDDEAWKQYIEVLLARNELMFVD